MKKYIVLFLGCISMYAANAQNENDILRYSQNYNLGTARSQAVGGAFGAVGADYSSVYLNPAGLGLYRRNEINLSGAITANTADAAYLGNTKYDSRTNFNIPTFGIVLSKVKSGLKGDATEGLINYNVAFGYTRTNDFQKNISYEGYNSTSNISQYYIQQANGVPYSQVSATNDWTNIYHLAWNAYLIDTANNSNTYYSPWFERVPSYKILQEGNIQTRGSNGEYNFNAAINIGNIVYFGAGLVLTNAHYEQTAYFSESDPNATVVDSVLGNTYKSSTLKFSLTSDGSGVAGRFGVIIRPIDYLRVGFTAQTATRINFTDNYNYAMTSSINYGNIGFSNVKSPDMTYKYAIITPAKFSGSVALLHPDYGFISFDAEWSDYTRGRLTSDDYNFSTENNTAHAIYKDVLNYRIGAELKVKDYYRLRAGYSLTNNPYKNTTGLTLSDLTRKAISIGAGYTDGQVFVDFASVITSYTDFYSPYVLNTGNTPTAKISNTLLNFVVTAGYRF